VSLGKWIGFFAFIVSLYILWQIREVLLLIFAAVVLANALNVLVERFSRSGMKRAFAVLLSIFLLLAVLVGFFLVIVPPFADQFQELSELVPKGIQRLSIWFEALQARISPQLMRYFPTIDQLIQQVQPFVNRLLGGGFTFFSSSLGVIFNLLLLDTPWKALAVLILYILIQQVESNLLTPYVMAQQVSLLPAITLLAQVFFATFFGFLGLFLALPLTVVAQVWLKEVLVKDILDQWNYYPDKQAELVIVSDSPEAPEATEEPEDVTGENAVIQDKPSTDDVNQKK
jgi:predicted PurR-regulated permease PerM